MASRALGAMLALVAAMLFLASLASPVVTTSVPAWFDGHPTVAGKERKIQDVHVGPFGAMGCNERGCSTIDDVDSQFQIVWYAEGGLVGLAALLAIVLAIGTWRLSDRRKAVAIVSLVVAVLCAAGAAVLIWQGPHIKASQTVEIPIGAGVFLVGGGALAMVIASLATLASRPQPLRLKSSRPSPQARARAAALRPTYEMPGESEPAAPQVTPPAPAPMPAPRAAIQMMAEIPTSPPFDAPDEDLPPAKSPTLPPPALAPYERERETRSTKSPTLPAQAPAEPERDTRNTRDARSTKSPTLPPRTPNPEMERTSERWRAGPDDRPKPTTNPPRSKAPSLAPNGPAARAAPNPTGNPATNPLAGTAKSTLPGLPPARSTPNPLARPNIDPPAGTTSATEPPTRATPNPSGKPTTNPPANASSTPRSEPTVRPTPIPPRGKGPTVPPPARTAGKATIEPPLRRSSQTIDSPPRRSNPTIDPPIRKSSATIDPPIRKSSATIDPPIRKSSATIDPPIRKSSATIDPPIRRSNPTLSSTVPPPPEHAQRSSAADLESDGPDLAPLAGPRTSVEIDAAGKAAAKAAEAKRHDAQAARVAAEEEARRRNADQTRIAEAKRREAEARAADNEAIAKRGGARALATDRADTSADAEIAERRAAIPQPAAPLTDDDLSTPRQDPSHEASRSEKTGQLWGAAPPRVDAVKLAIKRAPSATPADGVRLDGKRATTDVIEQPLPAPARSPSQLPISTASSSLPPPKFSSEPSSGPTPACPQCESPMAWVEEHLRFYCKQCRMYF